MSLLFLNEILKLKKCGEQRNIEFKMSKTEKERIREMKKKNETIQSMNNEEKKITKNTQQYLDE